ARGGGRGRGEHLFAKASVLPRGADSVERLLRGGRAVQMAAWHPYSAGVPMTNASMTNPSIMNIATKRGQFQGVRQILQYNRPYSLAALAAITAASLLALRVPNAPRALLLAGAAMAAYWLCASVLVSHYVYDRSPLYDLRCLAQHLARAPRRWVNIHAGL